MGLPVDRDNNLQVCVDPPRITAVTLPAVELSSDVRGLARV